MIPWIICEDGREYIDRFVRLFPHARFVHAADAEALDAALASEPSARGVILDLDFRRTPKARLIGDDHEDALAREQGLWLARRVRAARPALLIVLCADLTGDRRDAVDKELAPCRILSSEAMLGELAKILV